MATEGYEKFTEADAAAHNRKFQDSKGSAEYPNKAGVDHPRYQTPSNPEKPTKAHKYRAEPCIVTADLTLFRLVDIVAAEIVKGPIQGGSLKSRAARCGIVGDWFGSLKEGRRWIALRQLQDAGQIARLERQRRWPLHTLIPRTDLSGNFGSHDPQQLFTTYYVSDFSYDLLTQAATIFTVEDSKGVRTKDYVRKAKHFSAQYGISITET